VVHANVFDVDVTGRWLERSAGS